jgi:methionyl aminopeptidase
MGHLLRPGMVIAIEPMLNIGEATTRVLDDQWTVVTADSSLSSHFEHTVIITESGPEITTGVM